MQGIAALLFCLLVPAAWAGMGLEETRHLLARTGFDPDSAEVKRWSQFDRAEAVQRWVEEARAAPVPPSPEWLVVEPGWSKRQALKGEQKKKDYARDRRNLRALSSAWMQQMATTETPLQERMLLFWQNHFVSSHRRVHSAALMYRQHRLLREQALGNFRDMLHAIAKDPAMVIYLDTKSNRKGAANENFARELLELFTVGEGHYLERDIKEAARAFTGWGLNAEGNFAEYPKFHDDGEKTFFGVSGRLDGDDVLDIILRQPETSEFIVAKLWHEFISTKPDPVAVKRLAADFRKDYEIAPLLKQLFLQPAFFDPANRGTLIKSPVELIVGTNRFLKVPVADGLGSAEAASKMGQILFNPPNVKGWPTGEALIDADSLLLRYQFLGRAVTGRAPIVPKRLRKKPEPVLMDGDGDRVVEKPRSAQQRFDAIAESLNPATAQQLVLAIPPVEAPVEGSTPAERLRAWMLDPAYQMK